MRAMGVKAARRANCRHNTESVYDGSKGCEKSELSAQHRVSLGMVLIAGPTESLPESAMRAS